MIIVSAFLIAFTATPTTTPVDAYYRYHELSNQLAHHIEWIDDQGTRTISKHHAKALLKQYAQGVNKESFSVRHFSAWKNNKCFKILHLTSGNQTYRVFFQCCRDNKKNKNNVTKIKVTKV